MKQKMLICIAFFFILTEAIGQSIWKLDHLETVKSSLGQPVYATAYQHLLSDADRELNRKPLSVMMKNKTPASGDKHDYMSQARYFWPDPSKPDGLPYINRDGVSNPELEKLDRNRLGELANSVTTLSLAWYFSGEEKYAKKATELIRVWFFNQDTKMNPNLNFAQMIPGHNNGKGRSYGVIDTYSFVEMLDAVQILENSKSFTTNDSKQLKEWFDHLLDWILTSEQGKEEASQKNNHSIAYDVQAISFALYIGNMEIARQLLNEFPEKRIYQQIMPDGSQPHELSRTLAFHYSLYNISHMLDIFLMGQKIGISLDHATSADGRNFYKAIDFLTPYIGKGVSEWPYQQISEWESKQHELLRELYRVYILNPSRVDYLQLFLKNRISEKNNRFILLWCKADDMENAS